MNCIAELNKITKCYMNTNNPVSCYLYIENNDNEVMDIIKNTFYNVDSDGILIHFRYVGNYNNTTYVFYSRNPCHSCTKQQILQKHIDGLNQKYNTQLSFMLYKPYYGVS